MAQACYTNCVKRRVGLLVVATAFASLACMPGEEGTAPVAVSPVATATSGAGRPIATTPPTGQASPQASGTAVRTASPGPGTPVATPPGGTAVATPNTSGRAITVGDVQQAWSAKGISYQATAGAPATAGFSAPGGALTLTQAGQSVDVVVFVYPSQSATDQDWALGDAPAPKPGKTLGTFAAVWWNENVVMVLRERRGNVTNDVRDAFLGLGGPLPATPASGAPTRAPSGSATPAPAGGTITATAAPTTHTVTAADTTGTPLAKLPGETAVPHLPVVHSACHLVHC